MIIEAFNEISEEVKNLISREVEKESMGVSNAWIGFQHVKSFLRNLGIIIYVDDDPYTKKVYVTTTLTLEDGGTYSKFFIVEK